MRWEKLSFMKKIALVLVLISMVATIPIVRGQTALDVEPIQSNGLLSAQFDAPDGNPRMLVGHFTDGSFGIMRAAMTFELDGVPEGASIVSASLSIFARSAPWAPANPDGSPPTMVVKDGGALLEEAEGAPLAWGSFEVEGGDVSGDPLSSLSPDEYVGTISAENRFPSSDAFVMAVQKALDDGEDAIHLVVHCPELDEADPPPPGKNFYRIDNHENEPETVPLLHLTYAADGDGDGIEDAWELSFFPGDLSRLGRGKDNDGDGLTDEAEFLWKADPTKTDSDGDTLDDGAEVNTHGSDPSKTDSDGDDILDQLEIAANPFVTHPGRADTDGDGLEDNDEITQRNTDPTNADSDGDTYDDGLEVRLGAVPSDASSTPGLLMRGGMWTVLHAEIPEFFEIEELDAIIANQDYIDSVEVQLPQINFNNLVGGDYSESEINYPLFDEPTRGVNSLLRVTGSIFVKRAGQITLGYSTNSGALLRIDGEELTDLVEVATSASGRTTLVGTLNLTGGPHEVEFLQWFGGQTGVYLIAAFEPGEIHDDFDRENFELMPAFESEPTPFRVTDVSVDAGKPTITWASTPGESFVLERSTDLQDWLEVDDGIPAAGDLTSYKDEAAPERDAYYRVRK